MTDKKLNETALLNRYLKSRGINPGFVSKDQKVAHSKTNQFKIWARAHVNDDVRESITTELSPAQKRLNIIKSSINTHKEIRTTDGGKKLHSESVDKKDTITFDIPLLIRVLEFAREDLKSDINLHKMVERLLNIRGKGTLTMNQYNKIVKEECIDENLANMVLAAAKDAGIKATVAKSSTERKKDTEDMLKKRAADDKAAGVKRPLGGLYSKEYHPKANEEVVVEGSAALRMAKALQKAKQERELKDQSREAREKQQTPPVKENMEPMAACAQPGDGANTPDDVAPKDKNKKLIQMSKSARIIKSIYKRKGMSEELYDHEKEDKSTAPLGKKPKVQKLDADSLTKEAPQAAAVLTGGKTMTGEPRDTIEIDPMMKMRKQSGNSQKSV